jgi:TetR/AcrR family transcriptional repressor of nem operon
MLSRERQKRRVPTPRTAAVTRNLLLQAAFQEVYKSGFQSADLDAVLAKAGVTKGALYYHFANKRALGHAVVTEVIANVMCDKWLRPLRNAIDPIQVLVSIVQATSMKPEDLRGGCPLNNLAQEMSGLDEGFRKRLAKIFGDWLAGTAAALRAGQKRGLVRKDVDTEEAAAFLVATYEGYISLTKNSQDARVLQSGKKEIVRYLESLRAPGARSAGDGTQ